ncbi:PRD domain-containing protein [Faecalicatena sp. AGMB00832]|uniref:PRD domain-containing protein n=1 Tax=Faecalicatena faecalis TaxID=2726362 RepID=A0ABS6D852_9FIRM|nr:MULTISPECIES: PRD domain-containing protein [Faecalicatena]MBU3877783.1 PRD domain-containing protein [Faecalicatena faecalis]MCI6465564.1 PRD domain-containing protein [Faecalicatena sp.]MDY5617396.1 PRD domain-containing protein [Lachnospiraceae bacterium]
MGQRVKEAGDVMKISRVLNNSCVIILDDNQKEMILLGNGIGYSKRPGDSVDKAKIDKVFVMEDDWKADRFAELLGRVSNEIINISEDLIEYAHELLGTDLDEAIHISLPDHLDGAIENFRQGILLHNTLLLEIKKFYQKEFSLGERALKMIEEKMDIKMPEDEAGFIAMHFVNAQSHDENDQTRAIITLVDEMDRIISQTFGSRMTAIDKNSLIYCRYMTHLKFFAQRVLTKTYFMEGDTKELNLTIRKYEEEYMCSRKVCEFISKEYNYDVCEEEVMYLAVHLVQIMNRRTQKEKKSEV